MWFWFSTSGRREGASLAVLLAVATAYGLALDALRGARELRWPTLRGGPLDSGLHWARDAAREVVDVVAAARGAR